MIDNVFNKLPMFCIETFLLKIRSKIWIPCAYINEITK